MKKFKFELKQAVSLSVSGEEGNISARAEFSDSKNQYQVRYKAADGRAVAGWFSETELKAERVAKVVVKRKPAVKKAATKKKRIIVRSGAPRIAG